MVLYFFVFFIAYDVENKIWNYKIYFYDLHIWSFIWLLREFYLEDCLAYIVSLSGNFIVLNY